MDTCAYRLNLNEIVNGQQSKSPPGVRCKLSLTVVSLETEWEKLQEIVQSEKPNLMTRITQNRHFDLLRAAFALTALAFALIH
jgi:hypothetical protein